MFLLYFDYLCINILFWLVGCLVGCHHCYLRRNILYIWHFAIRCFKQSRRHLHKLEFRAWSILFWIKIKNFSIFFFFCIIFSKMFFCSFCIKIVHVLFCRQYYSTRPGGCGNHGKVAKFMHWWWILTLESVRRLRKSRRKSYY